MNKKIFIILFVSIILFKLSYAETYYNGLLDVSAGTISSMGSIGNVGGVNFTANGTYTLKTISFNYASGSTTGSGIFELWTFNSSTGNRISKLWTSPVQSLSGTGWKNYTNTTGAIVTDGQQYAVYYNTTTAGTMKLAGEGAPGATCFSYYDTSWHCYAQRIAFMTFGDPYSSVTNFSMTAFSGNNGSTLNIFNATMTNGGTTAYTTTTGTITTDKLSNSTSLYTVTLSSTGYLNKVYSNLNITTNTSINANMTLNQISTKLNYPSNNYHTNEAPINLTYNITSNFLPINCDVNINGLRNTTQTQTTNGTKGYSINLSNNNYNWTVNCTEGLNINTTTQQSFIIDTISPSWTIRTISTSNTTAIDRENQPYIIFNDTITDNNLFLYNMTVYYPNNTIWFSNSTFNTTLTQINISFNQSIPSNIPNGTYKINYYAEDDHTIKQIGDYQITPSKNSLKFKTENGNNIKIETREDANLSATKLIDRYTYTVNFTNQTIKTRQFDIKTDLCQLYYRQQSNYKAHFVSKCENMSGGNWIDFEGISNNYTITKNSDYFYTVTAYNSQSNIQFKSLGGLNTVNETYTFSLFVYSPPNITGTSPTQNFSVYDNTTFTFYTNATDPANLSLTYQYYYDQNLVYTGQNYLFSVPYSNHGQHNMSVNVTNGANKKTSYKWNFTIVNAPQVPTIISMDFSPSTSWYANLENTYLYCDANQSDGEINSSNYTMSMDYSTNGLFWTSLTPVFISGNQWRAYINISSLSGETLNYRCNANNGFYDSGYSYLNNFVTVSEAYYPPGNITRITPSGGYRDHVIPVYCYLNDYGTIPSYNLIYTLKANYNGISEIIGLGANNKALFDMTKINYTQNVSFTCNAYDGLTYTNNYTSQNVTRQHETKIIMFGDGSNEVMKADTPYTKGLLADFNNEAGINIISSFADCNGDGFYDYYWDYSGQNINQTKEYFKCYNRNGIINHKIGVYINKTNSNSLICGAKNTTTCKIERTYGVLVK